MRAAAEVGEELLALRALSAAGRGLNPSWPTDALAKALQRVLGLLDTRLGVVGLELRGFCRPCAWGISSGAIAFVEGTPAALSQAEEALGLAEELGPLAALLEETLRSLDPFVPPAWPRRPFHRGAEGPSRCLKLRDGRPCGLPVRALEHVQHEAVSVVSRSRTAYAYLPHGARTDVAIRAMAAAEFFRLGVEASGMCQGCAWLEEFDLFGARHAELLVPSLLPTSASGEHRGPGDSPDKGDPT